MTHLLAAGLLLPGVVLIATGTAAPGRAASCGPWMDASQSPDQRAHELLNVMTIQQKDQLLVGTGDFYYYGAADEIPGIPALCIPNQVFNDEGQGLSDGQQNVTAFPSGMNDAATWDGGLAYGFGQAIGTQAWQKGINVWLAPGIDIGRVPMNGRTFEYYGEDPYLSGQTAAAVVRGAQSEHVIATAKHYAANDQETNRMTVSADVDERTLEEISLPAFEAAVKQGGVGAVMCAYNRVNSVYACENPDLLTKYLDQFGFSGYVMSDWGATHSTVNAANAGLDQEHNIFPGQFFGSALVTAVQNGQVSMARFDDMVLRVLRSMFRIGLFEDPAAPEPQGYAADVDTPQADATALRLSEEGTVLLKNGGGILPLTATGQRIALIGSAAGAGATSVYNGGGSGQVVSAAPKVVTPYQGIQQRALANLDTVTYTDGSSIEDAVVAAKAADVAIVYGYYTESEGSDIPNLSLNSSSCSLFGCLPGASNQDQMIAAVAAANPHTIVVLNTGGPALMPWLDQVPGVLEAWYPGQEDGNAIAALLFGDVNPSGKLPMTFPRSMSDLPTQTQAQYPGVSEPGDTVGPHVIYSEGLNVGYRWYDDMGIQPLFPFGYGLSYTSFSYKNLRVKAARSASGTATVSFTVTNTGSRAGAEVPQLYVGAPADNYAQEPLKQLRGYARVTLQPGQSLRVSLPVTLRAVSYWSTASHSWQPETGCHPVLVGGSSRDVRLQGPGLDQNLGVCGTTTAAASGGGAGPLTTAALDARPVQDSGVAGSMTAGAFLALSAALLRVGRSGARARAPRGARR
jgi:beta-glucosidase